MATKKQSKTRVRLNSLRHGLRASVSYCSATAPAEPKGRHPGHPGHPMLLRRYLAGLLFCGSAWAQCNMTNQTGCGSVYTLPGTPNPSLAAFLSEENSSYQAISASIAGLPQPKILMSGQVNPANGSYLSTAVPSFGPAITAYMGLMAASGVTTQDVFMQTTVLAASAQYAPGSGDYTVPTDCAGGIHLALNQTVPAGSGPLCTMLGYYDVMFKYAANNGITIRGGFPQDTPQVTACGLTLGSIAESQFEHCILPLTKAEFARWGSQIVRYQVVIEPVAGMSGIQLFSISDTALIIQHFSTAIKAISPSTKIGAAATGQSWPTSSPPYTDVCYWQDWAATTQLNSACASAATNTYQYLDYLNIDLFGGSCDQSSNAYANELVWFQQHFLSSTANARHFPVFIGQTDPPHWCSIALRPTEPNAYLGAGDAIWKTSGHRNAWQSAFAGWASAVGIQSVSVFCTVPWFNYTANQSSDNCSSGAWTPQAMSKLAPTDAAAEILTITQWPAVSLQGNVHLTGKAHLGH
jgi:hypothetical protein